MIIVESNNPNFFVKEDLYLTTECGINIEFGYGEFLTLSKLENGNICLGDYCVIPKSLFPIFFTKLQNLSHVQLEESDTGDLECDGMFLKEYTNDLFDLNSYEFPKIDSEVNISNLKYVVSLN
jgi:hypothetical protein